MLTLDTYTRPTSIRDGKFYDDISDAPMSTAHAIARFFIPTITRTGWAVFMDADVLLRRNIADLFALADSRYALQVVKHNFKPAAATKKDGDAQLPYPRKNWSSVMLWHLAHPAHDRLTLDLLNSAPGRDLHNFCWLQDDEIGDLPEAWNWLVNHSTSEDPALVHFTEGVPNTKGHEYDAFHHEWNSYRFGLAKESA